MLPVVFFAKSIEGQYIFINRAYKELFALTDSDIIGKTDHEIFSKEQAEIFRSNDLAISSMKRSMEMEEVVIDSAGQRRIFRSLKFPYFDENRQVYATGGIATDITESKFYEHQAYHTAQLAAIGKLASGIGHEINNPLTIANGNVDLMRGYLERNGKLDSTIYGFIEKYFTASQRISNIVEGLGAYSKMDTDGWAKFNLTILLNTSLNLLKKIYERQGVNLNYLIPEEDIFIVGNEGRLRQVFINLIGNARSTVADQEDKIIQVIFQKRPEYNVLTIFFKESKNPRELDSSFGHSISTAIVEEHGGNLGIEKENGFIKYRVILPSLS